MLDSALWLLTMTAVVLLVPAVAVLLGVERHRHLAATEDTTRRVRLVVAATLVGLAALAVTALLDAEPLTAVVVAVVLAGSVLAWAPMSSTWAIRGIVTWALLVTGSVGFLAWLVQRTVSAEMDAAQLVVTVAAGLLLVLVLARGQRYVRESIGAHAGLETGGGRAPVPVVRPLGTLVVLLAAGGVVVAVADDGSLSESQSPQAGQSGTGTLTSGTPTSGTSEAGAPSSAPTPTLGLAPLGPSAVDAGLLPGTTSARGGIRATTAGLAPSAPVGVPVATGVVGSYGSGTETSDPGSEGRPATGPGGDGSAGTAGGSGGAGDAAGGGNGSGGTGATSGGSGSGGTGAGSDSGGAATDGSGTGGTGSGGSGTGGTGGSSGGSSGSDPGAGTPDAPAVPLAIRTPGYAKEKPHRPADAPSPGHGRLNNHLDEPSPVATVTGYLTPTLIPVPSTTSLLPSLSLTSTLPPDPTKTPGWAKEKPNRPRRP